MPLALQTGKASKAWCDGLAKAHTAGGMPRQVGCYAPVGGSTFLTNMKMAFSGLTFIRLRMTYTNWPTVRSAGTRYLRTGRQLRFEYVKRGCRAGRQAGMSSEQAEMARHGG